MTDSATFTFGCAKIAPHYTDPGFQKLVAGFVYAPCVVLVWFAMLSRHRFEERSTTAQKSLRTVRPWLRAIQLIIVAFVLRMGWFWADASNCIGKTAECKSLCVEIKSGPPCDTLCEGSLVNSPLCVKSCANYDNSGFSGHECAGPVFITLMNRIGQFTFISAFAIIISSWVTVSDDGKSRRFSLVGCTPLFFAVICFWLVLVTAFLLGICLLFKLPCSVGNQLYQSYILQVGQRVMVPASFFLRRVNQKHCLS